MGGYPGFMLGVESETRNQNLSLKHKTPVGL